MLRQHTAPRQRPRPEHARIRGPGRRCSGLWSHTTTPRSAAREPPRPPALAGAVSAEARCCTTPPGPHPLLRALPSAIPMPTNLLHGPPPSGNQATRPTDPFHPRRPLLIHAARQEAAIDRQDLAVDEA